MITVSWAFEWEAGLGDKMWDAFNFFGGGDDFTIAEFDTFAAATCPWCPPNYREAIFWTFDDDSNGTLDNGEYTDLTDHFDDRASGGPYAIITAYEDSL